MASNNGSFSLTGDSVQTSYISSSGASLPQHSVMPNSAVQQFQYSQTTGVYPKPLSYQHSQPVPGPSTGSMVKQEVNFSAKEEPNISPTSGSSVRQQYPLLNSLLQPRTSMSNFQPNPPELISSFQPSSSLQQHLQQTQLQQEDQRNSRPKNSIISPKSADIVYNSKLRAPIYKAANCWCIISYFELEERVGEVYKSTQRRVIVDGLCATSDNTRFCLGMIGNVNRNPVSAKARRQIGKGCCISQEEGDGIEDIYLNCLGESPIFVQSPLYAASINDDLSTVYRLPQDSRMKVFDKAAFHEMLNKAKGEDYFSVHSLQPICNIRISFVKGWGAYYNRPTITATPCWVEVQFMEALQVLANVLDSMDVPKREINSD